MAYAVLRFAKHKGGASKALSAHHERTKEVYASNPDIDAERTKQNFHLVTPRWSYEQEIRHRIRMAGCRVRKDSVKFVDTLVTVSPEFAKAHDAEMPEYFNRALGQFTRDYTQTVKRAADNKRRYAPGEGCIPPVLLSGVSKGVPPLAHDFACKV